MAGFAIYACNEARDARLRTVRAEIAALRFHRAGLRLALALKHNFNPAESRVPAGNGHESGRWTGGSSGYVRVAAAEEDERRPEEEFDLLGGVRDTAFNNSTNAIRRLEPNNPNLTYVTAGGPPSWDAVNAYQHELEAARARASDKIASGHAFESHASEFGVSSRADFAAIIRRTISSPYSQVRDLPRGRTMYYDATSNIVVFVDPSARDGGSIFKPAAGQRYIDRQ